MRRLFVYIHGKGGSASESEHYKALFPNDDVIGFDYTSSTPWEARLEFQKFFEGFKNRYESVSIIANSIGAFFSMLSLDEKLVNQAYFISPIVDMVKLIQNMMYWAKVSEKELAEKRIIKTEFDETLSWEYLVYVKNNPITWSVPTRILYGEKDNLTALSTITEFAERISAELTIMRGGEHWFHTHEQMNFLDNWILNNID